MRTIKDFYNSIIYCDSIIELIFHLMKMIWHTKSIKAIFVCSVEYPIEYTVRTQLKYWLKQYHREELSDSDLYNPAHIESFFWYCRGVKGIDKFEDQYWERYNSILIDKICCMYPHLWQFVNVCPIEYDIQHFVGCLRYMIDRDRVISPYRLHPKHRPN